MDSDVYFYNKWGLKRNSNISEEPKEVLHTI